MWPYSQANFSSLSLLCEAEKVFFIFIMLYIFPLNFLQAAERILKKAEQTHKQRVEVGLEIPLLKGIVIKWLFALNYCFNSHLWDTYSNCSQISWLWLKSPFSAQFTLYVRIEYYKSAIESWVKHNWDLQDIWMCFSDFSVCIILCESILHPLTQFLKL